MVDLHYHTILVSDLGCLRHVFGPVGSLRVCRRDAFSCLGALKDQGKTKGQTTKGQNRFIVFHTFSHIFRIFPQDFPLKNKGF